MSIDHQWPDKPVFIIDDDLGWIAVLTTALKGLGWRDVRSLSNSQHAVALAREFHPAVVLLDLYMAERNGDQILEEFQSEWPDLPIIIVTGSDRVENAVACMRKGARDYLTKPLRRNILIESLHRVLGTGRDGSLGSGEFRTIDDALPAVEHLPTLKEVPDKLIVEALRRSGGVLKDAAQMLGVTPQAICNRRRRVEMPERESA